MLRTRLSLAVLVALAATAGVSAASASPPPGVARPEFVPGELLVRFTSDAAPSERAAVRRRQGSAIKRSLLGPTLQLVELDPGPSVREAAAAFEQEPEVLHAEPDFYYRIAATPNDTFFGTLWGLNNTGQTVDGVPGTADADIDAPEAWSISTGSDAVTVAVVDSGAAYDHPDLSANMWSNPGESGGGKESNGLDDDANGLTDDFRGWDWVDSDNDPRDLNDHGTHVAGTIGARGNNGAGVAGVNWQVKLMPLRAADSLGSLPTSAVISAFTYAAANGAKVVNASFGGPSFSQSMLDAINAAPNTLFVASAGNGGSDAIGDDDDATPQYPCNYSAANLICVAATNQSDGLASFSNYGATAVDLGAPGVNVWSASTTEESVFSEDFETDISARWTTGGTSPWARTNLAAWTGSWSLADSVGDYADNTDSFARNTIAFSLNGRTDCVLNYWAARELASGDSLKVEASTDAAAWTTLATLGSTPLAGFDGFDDLLSAFEGQGTVYVRFNLVTDASGVDDGVYIDDVKVNCYTPSYDGSEYMFLSGSSMAAPHVSGVAALLWARTPGASVADVRAALLGSVDSLASLAGKTVTGGRLNAAEALGYVPPESPPTPVDSTRPVLSKLRVKPRRFRVGGSRASVATRRGGRVSFRLSERAQVRFRVKRAKSGRRVRGKCRRRTRRNRNRKRCTRWVKRAGGFTLLRDAGPNKFKFSGRLGGRKLPRGRYRLLAGATDTAGNVARKQERAGFRIVLR